MIRNILVDYGEHGYNVQGGWFKITYEIFRNRKYHPKIIITKLKWERQEIKSTI